jgi:hypothetical protein
VKVVEVPEGPPVGYFHPVVNVGHPFGGHGCLAAGYRAGAAVSSDDVFSEASPSGCPISRVSHGSP